MHPPLRHLSLVSALALLSALSTPLDAASPPHVLFIAIDDLNDWIGCLGGHPQALTPNLDRLAARGMLFTNAHCASPACQPSRATVFTGLMPDKTGVWSNESKSLAKLAPEAAKLPEPFASAGYRTLGTGKLLHDRASDAFADYFQVHQRWSPISHQQSEYTAEELPSKGGANPHHAVTGSQGREVILPLNRMPSDRAPQRKAGESFDWGPWDVPDRDFGDTRITDWAIEQLEATGEQPLFLAMGYYRPHIPLWAPKRFFERFKDAPAELPPVFENDLDDLSETAKQWAREPVTAGSHATVVKHDQWRKAVEAYLACTTYIDHEIGRVLDALNRSPAGENTIIVLWSDHGWHLGEKEHWGKWTGWERSTRVPLIIVPPKHRADDFAAAGSRCDQPVGLIDLFPTLAELCGVTPPEGLDGESLVPLLRDPEQKTGRRLITTFDPGNHSVRTERWRYLLYEDGSQELYDHHTDPHEWHNLAADPGYAEVIRELRGDL